MQNSSLLKPKFIILNTEFIMFNVEFINFYPHFRAFQLKTERKSAGNPTLFSGFH